MGIGICHGGATSFRIVPENVKVNNEVFLIEVLILIRKEDNPSDFGGYSTCKHGSLTYKRTLQYSVHHDV